MVQVKSTTRSLVMTASEPDFRHLFKVGCVQITQNETGFRDGTSLPGKWKIAAFFLKFGSPNGGRKPPLP
jgi:hypothetical protein